MRTAFLTLLCLLLTACQPPPAPNLTGTGMDMFAPVKVRLHPLSRIVLGPATTAPATQPSGRPTPPYVEARLELSDQFTDTTKSPGTITIELFQPTLLGTKGTRIALWTISIDAPESNRDHWDRTTRTYLFNLPITTKLRPDIDSVLLTATLTLPNKQAFSDDLKLPLK